jgi:hypothetical protein
VGFDINNHLNTLTGFPTIPSYVRSNFG